MAAMKLELIHLFDDGREVWVGGPDLYLREDFDGGRWQDGDGMALVVSVFESAREEALRVDEVIKKDGTTMVRKGWRWAAFHPSGRCFTGFYEVAFGHHQDEAFRWLFMGKL